MVKRVAIRGAGLSGLSVARELLRAKPDLEVSLFDIRPRYPHPQRTFCFFDYGETELEPVVSHRWNNVRFEGAGFERRVELPTAPYTMITGDTFFDHILSELDLKGARFRWECKRIELDNRTLHVDGESLTFDYVVDAAFDSNVASSTLWQSFAGIWISTESPVFDPTTALLMDIQESSQDAPASFMYVLPTSPREALVEHTTFSPRPMPGSYHLSSCFEWLERRGILSYETGKGEHGAIPMGLQGRHHDFAVGTNAGIVRPATGYAFLTALHSAKLVAKNIVSNESIATSLYPWWLGIGDHLFLRALRNSPGRGAALLSGMLERASVKDLIPFLAGKATFRQALSVWLQVPKIDMIRALASL
jgi:lycopene beta-cyclase